MSAALSDLAVPAPCIFGKKFWVYVQVLVEELRRTAVAILSLDMMQAAFDSSNAVPLFGELTLLW